MIGALWPANDLICPAFAQTFYRSLEIGTVSGSLNNDLIAFAAYHSILTLIRDYVNEPYLWACFIYMGP